MKDGTADRQIGDAERYVIVSADGHVGADIMGYKPYLEKRWHDEFDAWASSFSDPWLNDAPVAHTAATTAVSEVNWDSSLRQKMVEAEGLAAEVLFPNTYPPFYPTSAVFAVNPVTHDEYEHRFAGLRAHNGWLADFCAELPGRRAGVAQIFTNDPDAAATEIRRIGQLGLAAVLIPVVEAGSHQTPYHHPMYEPMWAAFAETDLTINTHGNGAFQNNFFGTDEPWLSSVPADIVANETTYFNAQRTINHLISAGVFERYPNMRFAITEVGPTTYWVKHKLRDLDFLEARARSRQVANERVGRRAPFAKPELSKKPSEYFARNVFLGVSFMERSDVELRHDFGVDRLMWGADFPHHEGTYPYTREALRATFSDVPVAEVRAMLGETAAKVYGLDLAVLREVAARIGPAVDQIAEPLGVDERPSYPDQTQCMALAPSALLPY